MKKANKVITKWFLILAGMMLGVGCTSFTYLIWKEHIKPKPSTIPLIRVQMDKIKFTLINYRVTYGNFPDSLSELANPSLKGRFPILKEEELKDLWGEPFRYEYEGDNFVIWSSGPDKKMWTADDVIGGAHSPYVESWRAKLKQAVEEQETNAVQEATTGTSQPPVGVGKTQTNRVPVTGGKSPTESAEAENTPWKLPLLIGLIAFAGAITAWRYFRKKTR